MCAQDLEWSLPELELKLRIQGALANMSVPNRTMLRDSKVYATMERWAVGSPWDPPHPPSRLAIPSSPPSPSPPPRSGKVASTAGKFIIGFILVLTGR